MNPNKETWQDRARLLLNPMIDQQKAYRIRQSLMLVNISSTSITSEDYQLLRRALE